MVEKMGCVWEEVIFLNVVGSGGDFCTCGVWGIFLKIGVAAGEGG